MMKLSLILGIVGSCLAVTSKSLEGSFDCVSSPPKTIPQSLVEDGICDCCNGHDEAPEICPDTCSDAQAAHIEVVQRSLAAQSKGIQSMAKFRSKHKLDNMQRNQFRQQMVDQAKHFTGQRSRIAAHLNSKRGGKLQHHEYQQLFALEQQYHELGQYAAIAQNMARASYGPGDEWMHAIGQCTASQPLTEKLSKGGSRTSIPKRYAYVVCFGLNITQVEYRPNEWKQQDAIAFGKTEVEVFSDGRHVDRTRNTEPEYGQPTTIGLWSGYLHQDDLAAHFWAGSPRYGGVGEINATAPNVTWTIPAAAHIRDYAMIYTSKDVCRSEDVVTTRRAYVMHVCPGDVPPATLVSDNDRFHPHTWNALAGQPASQLFGRVIHVEEDGLCTYKLYVESILACSKAQAKLLKEQLPHTP